MGTVIEFPKKTYDDMVYRCNCGSLTYHIVISSDMRLYLECAECETEMTEFQLELQHEI